MWQRIEGSLAAARELLGTAAPGARTADTVHVVLVLGDPDDPLMALNQGYFGLGGIPGAILLMMWPTETALDRIDHAAAHELHHNVRYANVTWDPMAVTVGEQVVAEGLAEAFVRELAGEAAMGPWATSLAARCWTRSARRWRPGSTWRGWGTCPVRLRRPHRPSAGAAAGGAAGLRRVRGRAALRGRPPHRHRTDRRRERRPARPADPRSRGRGHGRVTARPTAPASRLRETGPVSNEDRRPGNRPPTD